MHKAVTKEGPRAPLFCLGAVILIAASGPAAAQTVEQSDLALCASLATSELKLVCFEALTAAEGSQAKPAAEVAPETSPESATTKNALITAGTVVGVAESDTESVAPTSAVVADDELSDGPDDLGVEQPDDEYADVVDEIGREHLDHENVEEKEEAVVRMSVSEVVKGGYDVLYFHLTNGQVWRQIEPRRFSYPRNGEFDVIIDTGMMGDYRLRLDAGGPMTPIRRVK
jgi:hypothetical protein